MAVALALFAVLIAALSLYGVLAPASLTRVVIGAMRGPLGMPVAVGARLVLAVLLWFVAPESRTPLALQVLAVVALAAALVLPLVGSERIVRLMDRIAAWPGGLLRFWCLFGVAFAAFLFWAVYPALR